MAKPKRSTARRSDEALWRRIVQRITAGDRGGKPGQWSARKAQLAVKEYKDAGGRYVGPKRKDNSLARWTRQEWTTKSGRPSLETGERYLPKKALGELTESEYRKTTRKKRESLLRGEQFSKQPEKIAQKVKKFRANESGSVIIGIACAAIVAGLLISGKLDLS